MANSAAEKIPSQTAVASKWDWIGYGMDYQMGWGLEHLTVIIHTQAGRH